MKIIFVASGNKNVGTVSAFVRSQYKSLQSEGLEMILFPVCGHGWKAYTRAIWQLRALIRKEHPDVIHAHYSVCGIVAFLASIGLKTRIVVSILGSFPSESFKLRWVRFCIRHCWNATIVKSQRTADQIGIKLPVIPNGVNLEQFDIINQQEARKKCNFEEGKKYVIWCSDPKRTEKRFIWSQKAVKNLHNSNVILYPVYNKSHDDVVKYMCAADLLLLTSVCEGSPNVIKEAMACNCPIVSTDVGDVRWVTEGIDGTYIAPCGNIELLSKCIDKALAKGGRTDGRKRIIEYGLTTKTIAKKIKSIYESL